MVAAHVVGSHRRKVLDCGFGGRHRASRETEERVGLGQGKLPKVNKRRALVQQILTVPQSRCSAISATIRRLPGLHQTAVKIGRRELMEESWKSKMWGFTVVLRLLENSRHCSELQFLVVKPGLGLCTFTSCAFPKRPETFLLEDLPEAVDDSAVCRLARPGCHLEPGLDDISRGHQRGRRHALGDISPQTL